MAAGIHCCSWSSSTGPVQAGEFGNTHAHATAGNSGASASNHSGCKTAQAGRPWLPDNMRCPCRGAAPHCLRSSQAAWIQRTCCCSVLTAMGSVAKRWSSWAAQCSSQVQRRPVRASGFSQWELRGLSSSRPSADNGVGVGSGGVCSPFNQGTGLLTTLSAQGRP